MLNDFGVLGHLEACGLLNYADVHELRGMSTMQLVLGHHVSGVFKPGQFEQFVKGDYQTLETPTPAQWQPLVSLIREFNFQANPLPDDFPQAGMQIAAIRNEGTSIEIIHDPKSDKFWAYVIRPTNRSFFDKL